MSNCLKAWDGYDLKLILDEEEDDIVLEIKYIDHGDEFVLVQNNKGETYIYGLFVNRPGYSMEDTNFIHKPELFCKDDFKSELSNERCRWVGDNLIDRITCHVIQYDKEEAQRKFDNFIKLCDYMYDQKIYYKAWDYEWEIKRFLDKNDIATEDNLEKVKNIHFDSKIDGLDGICGKILYHKNKIYFDKIMYVKHKGKRVWVRTKGEYRDQFGCVTKSLSLSQFK